MTHEEATQLLEEVRVYPPQMVIANPKVVRVLCDPVDIFQDSQWQSGDEWFKMQRARSYIYCVEVIRYVKKGENFPTKLGTDW
jgi:hypothetical protein